MDTFTPDQRSLVMSRIHGANTKPELFVRKGLFARGYRYRVNCRDLPGSPDIKLTRHGAVIFMHGCFWHAHGCRLYRPPASNKAYWDAKIARNRQRDLEDLEALRGAGWRVCVVWECAVKRAASGADGGALLDGLEAWIEGPSRFIEFSEPAAGARAAVKANRSAAAYAAERSPGYASRRRPATSSARPGRSRPS